jgi:hypothetical protein
MANQVMEDFSQGQFLENRWKSIRLIFQILEQATKAQMEGVYV